MSAQNPAADPRVEALQAVIDRVVSWQDGATKETVREELARGAAEAQVDLPADVLDDLAERIHARADRVEAADVVEQHGGSVTPS